MAWKAQQDMVVCIGMSECVMSVCTCKDTHVYMSVAMHVSACLCVHVYICVLHMFVEHVRKYAIYLSVVVHVCTLWVCACELRQAGELHVSM